VLSVCVCGLKVSTSVPRTVSEVGHLFFICACKQRESSSISIHVYYPSHLLTDPRRFTSTQIHYPIVASFILAVDVVDEEGRLQGTKHYSNPEIGVGDVLLACDGVSVQYLVCITVCQFDSNHSLTHTSIQGTNSCLRFICLQKMPDLVKLLKGPPHSILELQLANKEHQTYTARLMRHKPHEFDDQLCFVQHVPLMHEPLNQSPLVDAAREDLTARGPIEDKQLPHYQAQVNSASNDDRAELSPRPIPMHSTMLTATVDVCRRPAVFLYSDIQTLTIPTLADHGAFMLLTSLLS